MPGHDLRRTDGAGRDATNIQKRAGITTSTYACSGTPRVSGPRPAREITGSSRKKIFDPTMGADGRWFADGVVNTCDNALDRYVAGGRADQAALIDDLPLTTRSPN